MSLKQPPGRIVVNTPAGQLPISPVNPADINEFSFLGDDKVHCFRVDGKEVCINRFKKAIDELSKTKF